MYPASMASAQRMYEDMESSASQAMEASDEVVFCAVERVEGAAFLVLCTTLSWSIYALEEGTTAPLVPVQLVMEEASETEWLAGLRCVRLYPLLESSEPIDNGESENERQRDTKARGSVSLGALFVTEQCREVDYMQQSQSTRANSNGEGDDLTLYSLSEQRLLTKLPSTSTPVVDCRANKYVAAILCEHFEIQIYDMASFRLLRIIKTSSLAMALGTSWIAYAGKENAGYEDHDGDDGVSFVGSSDEEGLIGEDSWLSARNNSFGHDHAVKTRAASYSALDVAQNVASGLYYLSSSIAPYLASSNGSNGSIYSRSEGSVHMPINCDGRRPEGARLRKPSSASDAGWVCVRDFRTNRVVCNFQCHTSALVTLSFDPSGMLLVSSSIKGQKLHVYRIAPPLLWAPVPRGRKVNHSLLYKLQRGITHASIQDVAFSADSKWINVTSSHGTSHLYAIHPEAIPITVETHSTEDDSETIDRLPGEKTYSLDYYTDMRVRETRTATQVLRIRHGLPPSAQLPRMGGLGSSTVMESAMDASQAILTQLAQSSAVSRMSQYMDDNEPEERRRKRRRRIACVFSLQSSKMAICAYGTYKLYQLQSCQSKDSIRSQSNGSGASTFQGLLVDAREIKSTSLLVPGRVKSRPLTPEVLVQVRPRVRSRNREKVTFQSFVQRSLPHWAHPRISFRVISAEHPGGQLLEVKRKGPNWVCRNGKNGTEAEVDQTHDQDQVFVLEMDSYFGVGGSPVFHGDQPRRTESPPPLELTDHISNAMASTLPSNVQGHEQHTHLKTSRERSRRSKKEGGTKQLHFTIKEMHFAAPASSDQDRHQDQDEQSEE